MRGRFLFTAALVVAAYVKGRVDATPLTEDWLPPALDPVNDVSLAMAETAATTVAEPAEARRAAEDDTASLLAELAATPVEPVEPVAEAEPGPDSRTWVIPVQIPPTPGATVTEAQAEAEPAEDDGDPGPAFDEIHPGWAAGVATPQDAVAGAEVCGTADMEGVLIDATPDAETPDGAGIATESTSDLAEQWTPAWEQGATADLPLEPPAPSEEEADPSPIAAVGPFAISGVAASAGDLAFGRVMFPARLEAAPSADEVALTVEHAANVPDAGVSVMRDAGFGPSPEGLTLVVAVQDAGRFVVRGHYTVRRPGAGASA